MNLDNIRSKAAIVAEARKVDAELADLAEKDSLTAAEEARFDELEAKVKELTAERSVRDAMDAGTLEVRSGDGAAEHAFNHRAELPTSKIERAIGQWKNVDDEVRHEATKTLAKVEPREVDSVVRHLRLTGADAYRRAFAKYVTDPVGFGAELSEEERAAWAAVRKEQRAALQLSGAVLPSMLDPTVILSNAGVNNPIRRLARTVQTTSQNYRFITSAGVTASFDGELTEVSDDTPTLTEVDVQTHKAQAYVQFSLEAAADQPNASLEIARMFGDAKDRLESNAFINGAGDGSNEPFGIVTEAVSAGTAISIVAAAGEDIVEADWYSVLEDLSPRWRSNATWAVELSTLNAGRKLYTPAGSATQVVDGDQILGLPYALASDVDAYSAIDAGANGTAYPVILGDFNQYGIVDRIGMTVDMAGPASVLNTSNNLPDGRVAWYAYWRVGAETLVDDAFRVLRVVTTA